MRQHRIGNKMAQAVAYVSQHPGCTKMAVATAISPHGSLQYGYAAVDRAIRAGLIDAALAGRGDRYSLTVALPRRPGEAA